MASTFTKSDLRYHVSQSTDSHFFTRKSMQFFGDTMANYGLRSAVIKCQYDDHGDYIGPDGVDVEVWELYRKQPVKHGLKDSAYFDKVTFKRRHIIK